LRLKYQPLTSWYDSARALARLHAVAAADGELRDRPYLLRFDRDYFVGWLHRAIAAAGQSSVRAATTLEGLLRRYPHVTELLDGHLQTLVHNDLAPKNVLVAASSRSDRICFVDWELAGVGCGALDLALLKDGLAPEAQQQMVNAYCDGIAGMMPLPDRSTFERLLAACNVHNWVYRVARSPKWMLPVATIERWASDAVEAATTL